MKNLSYIVQSYKSSIGVVSTDHDQQFLQWAIDTMRELNNWEMLSDCIKAVQLPINNQEANLPLDYQDYVRIGLCIKGVFVNFDMNDDICVNPGQCPCDSDIISNTTQACCSGTGGDYGQWVYPIFGQPYSYSYTVGSYGIGPGFYHGGYKINQHQKVIYFDRCVTADSFILEYIGDFMNDMGNAVIPDGMVDILLFGIDYRRKYFSPNGQMANQSNQAYMKFYQKVRDWNSKNQKMNKAEWLQLFRRYTYQGLKA